MPSMTKMTSKIKTLLGFGKRAGAVIPGKNSCLCNLKKIHLIIFALDTKESTKDTVLKGYKGLVLILGTKESLGQCIGREEASVVGVTDLGFAKKIREEAIKAKE